MSVVPYGNRKPKLTWNNLKRAAKLMGGMATGAYVAGSSLYEGTKAQSAKRHKAAHRSASEGPSSAVTTQHDSSMLYRRRRAPIRVRRRARRAYARHLKNQLKAIRMNTNTFKTARSMTALAGAQSVAFHIQGSLQSPQSSLETAGSFREMAENYLNAAPETTNFKMHVTSMHSDYTIVNTGADAVELDVYSFAFRKRLQAHQSGSTQLNSWQIAEYSEESKLPGASVKLGWTDTAWTPFANGALCRKIVITKKQRFYIQPGAAVSFIVKHNYKKPRRISGEQFTDTDATSFCHIPGLTRGIITVQKGVPSADNATSTASAVTVNHQCTYRFKIIDDSTSANANGY